MPANFRKSGKRFKSKNGLVKYQGGSEYVDDREYMMNMGGMAAEAGDFRKRPDEGAAMSDTAVMKNGGMTPYVNQQGVTVPGMYMQGGQTSGEDPFAHKWKDTEASDRMFGA
jgi:hypothetical protein